MKIVDINNEKINACLQFNAGNCIVSVSTIMNKNVADIAIFDRHTNELLRDRMSSIGGALAWIDAFGPRD